MGKGLRFIATVFVAFIIYILLAIPLNWQEVVLGLLVALTSSFLMIRFLPFDLRVINPVRIAKALVYLRYFLWKMIQANLNIASIVIKRKLKIKASFVNRKTTMSTPEGKLFLTSSITLAPGKLSVDIKRDNVFIHCITSEHRGEKETRKRILKPFEKYIREITE